MYFSNYKIMIDIMNLTTYVSYTHCAIPGEQKLCPTIKWFPHNTEWILFIIMLNFVYWVTHYNSWFNEKIFRVDSSVVIINCCTKSCRVNTFSAKIYWWSGLSLLPLLFLLFSLF